MKTKEIFIENKIMEGIPNKGKFILKVKILYMLFVRQKEIVYLKLTEFRCVPTDSKCLEAITSRGGSLFKRMSRRDRFRGMQDRQGSGRERNVPRSRGFCLHSATIPQ
ncbi:hypothetical protein ANTQUA_LOCUS609 [Anthophora quadrimaculata]